MSSGLTSASPSVLPPRRHSLRRLSGPPATCPAEAPVRRHRLDTLQTLLRMGFSKLRTEKAIAATGDRGAQLASDWILAHINDPTLDEPRPREYVLHLCPSSANPLSKKCEEFLLASRPFYSPCPPTAPLMRPHVSLTPFFTVQDERLNQLCSALQRILNSWADKFSQTLLLEPYASANFIGLFLSQSQGGSALQAFASQLLQEFRDQGITEDPQISSETSTPPSTSSGSLHLTLAYQFPETSFSKLKSLADEFLFSDSPPSSPGEEGGEDAFTPKALSSQAVDWEFRLLSREFHLFPSESKKKKEVWKVQFPHVPRENDELELVLGDYIYLDTDDVLHTPDGWIEGVSWLTGCTGHLPLNYVERVPESDAWTLHRTVPMLPPLQVVKSAPMSLPSCVINPSPESQPKEPPPPAPDPRAKRRVVIVRHGERVDWVFGTWIPYSFRGGPGSYKRLDRNMPEVVPERKGGPHSYYRDTPLTQLGLLQASEVGKGISESGMVIHHLYTSPSFRCIQTCEAIRQQLPGGSHLEYCIEPGLFEWLSWHPDGCPDWFSPEDLRKLGYSAKLNYVPHLEAEELNAKASYESSKQYYERSFEIMQSILSETAGNVLLVAHAPSLDTCSRMLTGSAPRTQSEMLKVVHGCSYGSFALLEEETAEGQQGSSKNWKIIEPPFAPFTNSGNHSNLR